MHARADGSVGNVKIRYYVTRRRAGGAVLGYWAPCLSRPDPKTAQRDPATGKPDYKTCEWKPTLMAELGFVHVECGPDGPQAWAIAKLWNDRWDQARAAHARGELVAAPKAIERSHPPGSIGEGFARYRGTRTWLKKPPRTKEDWLRGWKHIEPIFGDADANTVALEHIDSWYAALLETTTVREAYGAMKTWRAIWRVIANMRTPAGKKYCERDADPSLAVRRETPKPRNAIWFEGEAVRLVKRAWRMNYHGLAAALAVAWDTMLSPVDVRTLTRAQLSGDADGPLFQLARAKTGKAAIGTLSKRTERLLKAYLAELPKDLHPSAPIFRTPDVKPVSRPATFALEWGGDHGGGRPRRGVPYQADVLGRHFRKVRSAEFPRDRRQLIDFRRSGAVEAEAGEVDLAALAGKMANSIDTNKRLQGTYLPTQARVVRLADAARTRGRKVLRGSKERS